MPRRIIFHIGLAKTGTTSLQRFCVERRRWLFRQGLLYPRAQCGRANNHSPLVASYIAHRPEGPTVSLRWIPRRDAVAAVVAEIERSSAGTVLISSEHFANHFDRSEAKELAEDFRAYDPTVVVTLRDPHARFLSAYNTHVTAGGHLSIEDFARSTLIPGVRHMSGSETVRIWAEAFGTDAIRIVDYDDGSDTQSNILSLCGITAGHSSLARYRDRPSLPPMAVEALRAVNAAIAEDALGAGPNLGSWLRATVFSILCRRDMLRHSEGRRGGDWIVSPRTMAELDAAATSDRSWIAATFGIDMRGSNGRGRIIVRGPDMGNSEAQDLLARALLHRIGGGQWRSTGLVATAFNVCIAAFRGRGSGYL